MAKAVSWATLGFAVTLAFVHFVSGDLWNSLGLLLPAAAVLSIGYYFYDAWWDRWRRGRPLCAAAAMTRSLVWRLIVVAAIATVMMLAGGRPTTSSMAAVVHGVLLLVLEAIHDLAWEWTAFAWGHPVFGAPSSNHEHRVFWTRGTPSAFPHANRPRMPLMHASAIARPVVTIVDLRSGDYGSLNEELLGRLRAELLQIAAATPSDFLIVDASNVRFAGARFLGVLAELGDKLKHQQRKLVFCGPCSELLRTTGLDEAIPSFSTRREATAWCAQQTASVAGFQAVSCSLV